jgi:predicted O-methyltransferase YrrM
MNTVIDQIYRDQQVIAPDGTVVKPFPTAISRQEGEALYHLIRQLKPRATLEVGMGCGLSTLFLCQGLRDNASGRHTAIDPFQSHFKGLGLHNIRQAGLSGLLTFFEEASQVVLARLASEKRSCDLIFIDGSHLFDAAFVDFYFADMLIPVGGVLVFDDLWMPAVRKVLRFVLSNRHYEVAEDLMGKAPPFMRRHLQNLKYQAKKRLKGKRNQGAGSEMSLHGGRNTNWCVVRKTKADDRPWDHFKAF